MSKVKTDWQKYTLSEVVAIVVKDPFAWGAVDSLNKLEKYINSYIKYEQEKVKK